MLVSLLAPNKKKDKISNKHTSNFEINNRQHNVDNWSNIWCCHISQLLRNSHIQPHHLLNILLVLYFYNDDNKNNTQKTKNIKATKYNIKYIWYWWHQKIRARWYCVVFAPNFIIVSYHIGIILVSYLSTCITTKTKFDRYACCGTSIKTW